MNPSVRLDTTSTLTRRPRKASLADQVYEHVTDQILSGRWVSGDIISRKEVARKLDVSLAPVGEALVRLTNEGFLETAPHRHTRVRIVRREDARGQFALRFALERQAVAMAHGEPVRQAKQRLLELARELDEFPPKDPSAWPAEMAFHQALVDLANCPALSASHERVMRRNYFFSINSAHIHVRTTAAALAPHSNLVEALCTDDPDAADRAIMTHYAHDRAVMLRPGTAGPEA